MSAWSTRKKERRFKVNRSTIFFGLSRTENRPYWIWVEQVKKSTEIFYKIIWNWRAAHFTHARYQYSVMCAAQYLRVQKCSISEFQNRVPELMSNATNSQNLVILGLPEHAQNYQLQDPVNARHSLLIPLRAHARWDKAALFKSSGCTRNFF